MIIDILFVFGYAPNEYAQIDNREITIYHASSDITYIPRERENSSE